MTLPVKIKKLNPEANLGAYAHPGDAGLDLHSLEDHILQPGERKIFMLGFALEFPPGHVGLTRDRSSMAKAGLIVSGGVFDSGYRGEYNVQLTNLGSAPYEIKKGHKIAQLVIFPIAIAELTETDTLGDSSRGTDGFGSTGK